jgi:hypothetical protein
MAWYGQWGALTSTEDLVHETPEWRDKLFAARAPEPSPIYPPGILAIRNKIAHYMFPGGMGGGMGQLALQQLLVQMDGMDEPPGFRKWATKRFNTFLDALYVIPTRIGSMRLRLRPVKPRSEQVYFIGATNVPLTSLDPALLRPGRMGRHIYFRTPRKEDRADIFDLYLGRVSHVAELDTPERRDELARITNGYSPAMIEQVCSMALTLAHSDARQEFEWKDVLEAITTVESGTAENVQYAPDQSRATAIHEAGHAIASHLYVSNADHTRLSIRKRGLSLGHYQWGQKEERVGGIAFRHEEIGELVVILGAMAAEHTFYGENSTGVGGDLESATVRAAWMVGVCGMGPEPIDLGDRVPADERDEREKEIMERYERIGQRLMNRVSHGSAMAADPIAAVLSDPGKRNAAAQILGQAYVAAQALIEANRVEVEAIADTLVERRELHGDEVVALLERHGLTRPQFDVMDDSGWPKL